jgi:hypothetical protein
MAPGKPRGAPGEIGGQLPGSQRTRSRRKASRPYRPDPGDARTGNRGDGARGGEGKGEEARPTVNSVARVKSGRAGDVDPRRCWFRSLRFGAGDERAEPPLRTEGRLRRAGKRPGDGTFPRRPGNGASWGGPRETGRTPGSGARCNTRARHRRRKPSRWWKTTRTERGREVALASRRENPRGSSREWTPVSPGRRRGDLWKSQERQSRRETVWADGDGRCRERRRRRSRGVRGRGLILSRAARAEVLGGERVHASAPANARRAVGKPMSHDFAR